MLCVCNFSVLSANPDVAVDAIAQMSQQLTSSQRNQTIRLLTSLDETNDKRQS